MENSGRFMSNLIDDMLDLAHITRKEINLDTVSLTNIALHIRDKPDMEVRHGLKQKPIKGQLSILLFHQVEICQCY